MRRWMGESEMRELDSFRAVKAAGNADDFRRVRGFQNCLNRIGGKIDPPSHPVGFRAWLERAQLAILSKCLGGKGGEHRPNFPEGYRGVSLMERAGLDAKIVGTVVRACRTIGAQNHGNPVSTELFQGERLPGKPGMGGWAVDDAALPG